MDKLITLNSIKHPDHYNRCEICDRTRNLNECNILVFANKKIKFKPN